MSRATLFRMAGCRLRALDRARAILGVWRAPDGLDDETVAMLVGHAEAFLRAGGSLTPRLWLGLSRIERAAFVAAGDRLAADRAGVVGLASSGPQGLLRTLGILDGGRAAADLAFVAKAQAVTR